MRGAPGVLLVLLILAQSVASPVALAANDWDPGPAIDAYAAALNAHDLPAALALFGDYGSATDLRGRHFEGRAGLTEFLLANGFGSPEARLQTERVHIVGNRAVWRYTSSWANGTTEVRLAMSAGKISVFAMMAPPATPIRQVAPAGVPWPPLLGVVVLAGLLVGGLVNAFARALSSPKRPVRSTPGALLTALARKDRSKLI